MLDLIPRLVLKREKCLYLIHCFIEHKSSTQSMMQPGFKSGNQDGDGVP